MLHITIYFPKGLCGAHAVTQYFLLIPCGYFRVAREKPAFGHLKSVLGMDAQAIGVQLVLKPWQRLQTPWIHHTNENVLLPMGIPEQYLQPESSQGGAILLVCEFSQEVNSFLFRNIFHILKQRWGRKPFPPFQREKPCNRPNSCCSPVMWCGTWAKGTSSLTKENQKRSLSKWLSMKDKKRSLHR